MVIYIFFSVTENSYYMAIAFFSYNKIIMYSLRTDDIPGARPKLRHYEMKIVRHEPDNKPTEYVPDFGSRIDQKSVNLKINNP